MGQRRNGSLHLEPVDADGRRGRPEPADHHTVTRPPRRSVGERHLGPDRRRQALHAEQRQRALPDGDRGGSVGEQRDEGRAPAAVVRPCGEGEAGGGERPRQVEDALRRTRGAPGGDETTASVAVEAVLVALGRRGESLLAGGERKKRKRDGDVAHRSSLAAHPMRGGREPGRPSGPRRRAGLWAARPLVVVPRASRMHLVSAPGGVPTAG